MTSTHDRVPVAQYPPMELRRIITDAYLKDNCILAVYEDVWVSPEGRVPDPSVVEEKIINPQPRDRSGESDVVIYCLPGE
jgi:hypothetical protein